jgi:hypothetical protein
MFMTAYTSSIRDIIQLFFSISKPNLCLFAVKVILLIREYTL